MNDFMKVIEFRHWSSSRVRDFCVSHNWYTCGDCQEYTELLNFVSNNDPSPDNLYTVARDIYTHSDFQEEEFPLETMMYLLTRDCVSFTYEIKE